MQRTSSSTKLTINFTKENVDLFLHQLCFNSNSYGPSLLGFVLTQQLTRLLKLLDKSTTAPDADHRRPKLKLWPYCVKAVMAKI